MYIINDKVIFLNVMKTGTRTMRTALGELARLERIGFMHGGVDEVADKYKHLPIVCVVREPISWYTSCIKAGPKLYEIGNDIAEAYTSGCNSVSEVGDYLAKTKTPYLKNMLTEMGVFNDNVTVYDFTDLQHAFDSICKTVDVDGSGVVLPHVGNSGDITGELSKKTATKIKKIESWYNL